MRGPFSGGGWGKGWAPRAATGWATGNQCSRRGICRRTQATASAIPLEGTSTETGGAQERETLPDFGQPAMAPTTTDNTHRSTT